MYCIVDIETTGGNHKTGKITEVAIFKHDGLSIVDSYTTLVDPECPIPYFISNLTGITNEMVATAPKFYEVAKEIIKITEGCIFVAHNVGFDYGFIREEFKNLGYDFSRERICTVKSARKAFPGRDSYSLGKLCKDIGIELKSHHRAEDDARATTELFQLILNQNQGTHKGYMEKDIKESLLNPNLDRKILDSLPEETGVYYFINEQKEITYIGKSNNIKTRIQSHFRNTGSSRAMEMIKTCCDLKYELTGSELIALLKESDEIKSFKPKYNRAQKRSYQNYGIYATVDESSYIRIEVKKVSEQDDMPITAFKSFETAKSKLFEWTERFNLCQKLTGLYHHTGPCFAHQVEECLGACLEKEPIASYNARVKKALAYLEYKHPSFVIIDEGRNREEKSVILIEQGVYQGFGFIDKTETVAHASEFKDFIEKKKDNRDVKQIIKSYLSKRKIQKLIPF